MPAYVGAVACPWALQTKVNGMPWPAYVRAPGMTWCVPCLPWGVPRHGMAGLGGCLGIPWPALGGCQGMPWPALVGTFAFLAWPWGVPSHAMVGLSGCLGIPWPALGGAKACHG
jgi:hypothetical protein